MHKAKQGIHSPFPWADKRSRRKLSSIMNNSWDTNVIIQNVPPFLLLSPRFYLLSQFLLLSDMLRYEQGKIFNSLLSDLILSILYLFLEVIKVPRLFFLKHSLVICLCQGTSQRQNLEKKSIISCEIQSELCHLDLLLISQCFHSFLFVCFYTLLKQQRM